MQVPYISGRFEEPAPKLTAVGMIPQRLDELANQLNMLDNCLADLRARLAPVLCEREKKPDSIEEKVPIVSALTRDLLDKSAYIQRMTDFVVQMISDLEL